MTPVRSDHYRVAGFAEVRGSRPESAMELIEAL